MNLLGIRTGGRGTVRPGMAKVFVQAQTQNDTNTSLQLIHDPYRSVRGEMLAAAGGGMPRTPSQPGRSSQMATPESRPAGTHTYAFRTVQAPVNRRPLFSTPAKLDALEVGARQTNIR
jgi:hypothetical protein